MKLFVSCYGREFFREMLLVTDDLDDVVIEHRPRLKRVV